MARIVVPEYLPEDHVVRLGARHDVVYDPDLYADLAGLHAASATAEAIVVRNRTRIDQTFLAVAPQLRVVGRLGVGLDNIDLEACTAAGVEVIPAIGGNTVSVAEYVLGAILFLSRGVYEMTRSMVTGEWPRQGHAFGNELLGRTIGIVGLGAIGQEVAKRAAAFGMHVVAHDPHLPAGHAAWSIAEATSLAELLARAHVVTIHAPLDDSTRHLIGAPELRGMRRDAIVINTSRGGVVDETALVAALRNGDIKGAALDVFEAEPLQHDAARRFEGIDNLVLTPHVAGNTHEAVTRVATMTVDAVLRVIDGDPPTS